MERANFVFDVNRRHHISDKKLLEDLRRFGAANAGRPFLMREFDAWGGRICGASTIMKRFGGWRRALTVAGIKGARRGKYSRAELMGILEDVWREIERPPGTKALKRIGRVSQGPFLKQWGTLRHACEKLAKFHRGEISREELVAADPRGARPLPLRASVRWGVLERDGQRCLVCGKSAAEDPAVVLEVDHIVPIAQGGGDEVGNLRTLCRECNRGKGAL